MAIAGGGVEFCGMNCESRVTSVKFYTNGTTDLPTPSNYLYQCVTDSSSTNMPVLTVGEGWNSALGKTTVRKQSVKKIKYAFRESPNFQPTKSIH